MRLFSSIIFVSALIVAIPSRSDAQRSAEDTVAEWTYRGKIPVGDSLVEVEFVIERDPLIEGSVLKSAPSGWRYDGMMYLPGHRWYPLSGLDRGGGAVTLTVGAPRDTIVGSLDVRFDGGEEMRGVWRPAVDSKATTLCTLRLRESGGTDFDGGFETDFIPFWNRFRDAVRSGNRRAVAGMTRFPIGWRICLTSDWEPDGPSELGRREFVGSFNSIFDEWIMGEFVDTEALNIRTAREGSDIGLDEFKGRIDRGTLIYYLYCGGGEYSETYYFARVKGKFKLIHCTCAG